MVTKATPLQPASPTRGGVVLLFILLATASVLIALPHGIAYGIKSWITNNSDASVKIEDVDFNPVTATLVIYGLDITQKNKSTLLIPELNIRMTWTPLLHKAALIDNISLSGARIEVDLSNPANLIIGGIPLPNSASTETKASNPTPWALNLEKLTIQDTEISYKDSQLDVQFRIDNLQLTELASYFPNQPATLELEGSLNDAPLSLKSKITPFSSEPKFNNMVLLDKLDLKPFAKFIEPNVSKLEGKLFLDNNFLIHLMADGALKTTQNGIISLLEIDVESEAGSFKNEMIQWEGKSNLEKIPTNQLSFAADGALQLKPSRFTQIPPGLNIEQEGVKWQGNITFQNADEKTSINLKGELNLDQTITNLPYQQTHLLQEQLTWNGDLQLNQSPQGSQEITASGKLNSNGLTADLIDREAILNYDDLEWNGEIFLNKGESLEALELKGKINLSHLEVLASKENYTLLALEQLQTGRISAVLNGEFSNDQLNIRQLTIGRNKPVSLEEKDASIGLLQADNLKISGIRFSEQTGIEIEAIEQENLSHLTLRNHEGKWSEQVLVEILQRIIGSDAQTEAKPAKEKSVADASSSKKPMPIHIGQVHLLGDNFVSFHDETSEPPYHADLNLQHFSISEIDNTISNKLSPVELEATVNQQSSIIFSGDIAPFASQLTLDIEGKIEGLALPPLTAYTSKLLGYSLDSGELNANIKLTAMAGELEGNTELTLRQLNVSPLSKEKMKGLEAQLSIPLDTALGMLRDSNNSILLNLPLSGNSKEFKVDPSDAINQAIGKALKKGATTYLTAALFPFGTMLAVAQMAGEEMAKIRLDPVFFLPGSILLNPQHEAYLEKIANILKERPEIYIKLCGKAIEDDRTALMETASTKLKAEQKAKSAGKKEEAIAIPVVTNQQLESLAEKRATAIETYMAKQYQIKKNRLISCQPIVEPETTKEQPRVEMLL